MEKIKREKRNLRRLKHKISFRHQLLIKLAIVFGALGVGAVITYFGMVGLGIIDLPHAFVGGQTQAKSSQSTIQLIGGESTSRVEKPDLSTEKTKRSGTISSAPLPSQVATASSSNVKSGTTASSTTVFPPSPSTTLAPVSADETSNGLFPKKEAQYEAQVKATIDDEIKKLQNQGYDVTVTSSSQ